ncbi:hypothetical protein HPP92_010186 [Vanilla planifolia]|uniref:Cation/H+ exchanger transmembrane domain-containing protein n=1 Tax=Vanilla planifolia TaxID=51239 RepID=A0A835R3L6_VANPL|nr:hypothetical protein HPP92_010186 [Vanilla planifolia]
MLMTFCGLTAVLCSAKLSEGLFVGSFLSMSSTAIVSKVLVEKGTINSIYGQVTMGTLILQDCAVGLLFALLPVLGGNNGLLHAIMYVSKLVLMMSIFLVFSYTLSMSFLPRFLRLMVQLSAQGSNKLGISLELGSFIAGVMISTTDFAQYTLEQVESIRNLFAALFLASIGMLIQVQFLWNHADILLASVILVVIVKTIIVTEIGEFAFVLLSRASSLHLVEGRMYLLLLGTTAFSLITTPLMFKTIPVVLHLGNLMGWFPSESI